MASLRAILNARPRDRVIAAPGVYDMISLRIADRMGFDVLYMTGYGAVASLLGLPDAGLASFTDMVDRVGTMAGIAETPQVRAQRHRDAERGGEAVVADPHGAVDAQRGHAGGRIARHTRFERIGGGRADGREHGCANGRECQGGAVGVMEVGRPGWMRQCPVGDAVAVLDDRREGESPGRIGRQRRHRAERQFGA